MLSVLFRTFVLLLVLSTGFGILPSSVKSVKAAEINSVFAIVNGDIITAREYNAALRNTQLEMSARNVTPPPQNVLKEQVLNNLINERLQLQIAEQYVIVATPQEIDNAVLDIAQRNNLDVKQLELALENQGVDFNDFRDRLSSQIIIQKIVKGNFYARTKVSDKEVDQMMAMKSQGKIGRYKLSQVTIPFSQESAEQLPSKSQALEQMKAVAEDLKLGKLFSEVVTQYSKVNSTINEDWINADSLPTPFLQALTNMEVGDVSSVIETQNAFSIIRLNDKSLTKSDNQGQEIPELKLSQIVLERRPNQKLEHFKYEMNDIDNLIKSKKQSFANLARIYSSHSESKLNGGDLGWRQPSDFDANLGQILFTMLPGQISAPLELNGRIYFFKVDDRRNVSDMSDIARDEMRTEIQAHKSEQDYEEWIITLREQSRIEIIED